MKYRTLGKTGLDVSILSFGASSLGSVFRNTDDQEAIKAVHAAIDSGINYIDVSPYYGLLKAETVLGQAIQSIPRDSFLLSTKVGRYGADVFDFSAKRITESIDESLTRLGVDHVDICFLHDIEFVPAKVILEEAIPTLQRLKEQGKIRYSGICGLPLELFEHMLTQVDVDAIISYCHYALNDTSLVDILPLLASKKVGLVNASPLSMGLLGMRGTPDWHPASARVKELCMQASIFCESQGTEIAKLAIQYSTMNEQIPTTLVSTANPANIIKNAAWANEPIDHSLLAKVLDILSPIHNESWTSGLPEYNKRINR